MQVTIGFSKRNMTFSRFLRWVEKRPYSHCYVSYANHVTGQELILHAAGFNIHTITKENFIKHGNIIVKEYPYTISDPAKIKNVLSFMFEMSGRPYGWKQIIGVGIARLSEFLGYKIKNPLADKNKTMVCSEFCAHVVQKSGIAPAIDLDYAEEGGPSWLDKELNYKPV